MSDLIKGFQSGEQQKKSWFKRTHENFLQEVSEHPVQFVFSSMAIGIGALYLLKQYFIPVEDVLLEKAMQVMGMPFDHVPATAQPTPTDSTVDNFNNWLSHRKPFEPEGNQKWWLSPYNPNNSPFKPGS